MTLIVRVTLAWNNACEVNPRVIINLWLAITRVLTRAVLETTGPKRRPVSFDDDDDDDDGGEIISVIYYNLSITISTTVLLSFLSFVGIDHDENGLLVDVL